MDKKPLLEADYGEQTQVVNKLIDHSREDGDFYLMLVLSTLVTTLGLLLNNAAIVIGGMLIAPLLSPILAMSMGVVTASSAAIRRSGRTLLKSGGLVLVIAMITTWFVGLNLEGNQEVISRVQPNLAFVYVALISGLAAAFSWVRPRLSATLPGVAVAVALLPPLCVTGIGLAGILRGTGMDMVSGSLQLFLINFVGILVAAVLIFSLMGFYRVRWEEERRIREEQRALAADKK